MIVLGDKIEINTGESFYFVRKIYEKDGSPFVLPKLTNPFLLISISSNRFEQSCRIIYRYWIDLSTYPSFEMPYAIQFPDNNIPESIPESKAEDYAVWYKITDTGREYYYWVDNGWQTYEFIVKKFFKSLDTINFLDGVYTYELRIVSGELMNDYLTTVWKQYYPNQQPPLDNRTLYYDIYRVNPEMVESINYNAAIAKVYSSTIILPPKQLIVYANN